MKRLIWTDRGSSAHTDQDHLRTQPGSFVHTDLDHLRTQIWIICMHRAHGVGWGGVGWGGVGGANDAHFD